MNRLLLASGSALLILLGAACERGDTGTGSIAAEPQAVLDRARQEMIGLGSYRVEFTSPARSGDAAGEQRWVIEFEAPARYRLLTFVPEGEREERCEPIQDVPGRSGETCFEVFTEVTGQTVVETLLAGDAAYGRQCEEVDAGCSEWLEGPRPDMLVLGPTSTYLPQWPLVMLEMARDVDAVEAEAGDDVRLIHLRGSVNHLRAILENERRIAAEAGVASFGTECSVEATEQGDPLGQESCRELTFEESLKRQGPELSFYDEQPATLDVWLSPEDLLIHRIEIAPPQSAEAPSGEVALTMEYTGFNDTEVEAPR